MKTRVGILIGVGLASACTPTSAERSQPLDSGVVELEKPTDTREFGSAHPSMFPERIHADYQHWVFEAVVHSKAPTQPTGIEHYRRWFEYDRDCADGVFFWHPAFFMFVIGDNPELLASVTSRNRFGRNPTGLRTP